MKFCPKCGNPVKESAKFCESCGAELVEQVDAEVIHDGAHDSSRQRYYDRNMSDDAKRFVHPADGQVPANVSSRSRLAAALFAFFLGWCGAHEYYVGRIVGGIFMSIFFWTGIPSIVAFIQFILILCGVYNDVDGKPILLW